MNTKLLKYAVDLASYNSIKAVAEKYSVSRSSVSRNIKRLENEIGVPLFNSSQTGIVPTHYGEIFLRYSREILSMDENLKFDLASGNSYSGTVTIGMGTTRTLAVLTEVLPRFRQQYPNIQVQLYEMSTTDLVESIFDRQLDFAVVSEIAPYDGLSFEPILTEELVLVAPKDDVFAEKHSYENNGRKCVHLESFADKPFILGHVGQKSRAVEEALFARLDIKPNIVFQARNNYTIAMMAYNGLAYALVPSSSTQIQNSVPHYYMDPELNAKWNVGIAYLSSSELSKAAMMLKSIMLDVFTS